MTPEHKIQNDIRNWAADKGVMMFRANVGKAWVGAGEQKLPDGRLVLSNPRPFSSGLPSGFADLFGVKEVVITKDMVGKKIGVAYFIEVKTPTGKISEQQANFCAAMLKSGSIAGVARSVKDAIDILSFKF